MTDNSGAELGIGLLTSPYLTFVLPALSVGLIYLAVKIKKPLTPFYVLVGVIIISIFGLWADGWTDPISTLYMTPAYIALVVSPVILRIRTARGRR